MARRRFRSNQRHEPTTERSFQEYILSNAGPQTSRVELLRLIRGGEDTFLELKVKLSNPERIAQEIVALANTGGGFIVFGVNDQMRVEGVDDAESVQDELAKICREEIQPPLIPFIDRIAFDNGRRVVALEIDGKRRPYRTRDGRFYIRIGAEKREASREEFAALLDESRPVRYENVPVLGASIEDIDEAHLWSFLREFAGDAFDEQLLRNYPTGEVLERDLLLATVSGGNLVPTVAGLLLFGVDDRVATLVPRSTLTATRFAGESTNSPVVERVELKGNLLTIYESAARFVERYCDLWDARPRLTGSEIVVESPVAARANYHRAAVNEVLANLLIHRDLVLRDQQSRLHIFDHGLEFVNPRRSSGFSQKAVRYGVPQQLNPQLAAMFSNRAYGVNLPSGGVPMVLRETRRFGNKRTDIVTFNDEFRVRLYGT